MISRQAFSLHGNLPHVHDTIVNDTAYLVTRCDDQCRA
jgi:hypothetical protein